MGGRDAFEIAEKCWRPLEAAERCLGVLKVVGGLWKSLKDADSFFPVLMIPFCFNEGKKFVNFVLFLPKFCFFEFGWQLF